MNLIPHPMVEESRLLVQEGRGCGLDTPPWWKYRRRCAPWCGLGAPMVEGVWILVPHHCMVEG